MARSNAARKRKPKSKGKAPRSVQKVSAVALANDAFARGDIESAAAHAKMAVAESPQDALAWALLSISQHRANDLESAIASGKKAVELAPTAADLRTNLGVVLRAAGRLHEAELAYRMAIATDESFAAAHYNLGNLLSKQEKNAEAEQAYAAAVAVKDNYAEAWHGLGIALHRQSKFQDALSASKRAVELSPENSEYLCDLGMAYFALEDLVTARSYLEAAITAKPDYAIAHGNLGAVELRASRVLKAELASRRAAQLAPDEERWVTNLGVISKDLGRFDEAEQLFRRALSMRPNYALAHSNLLFCLNYHPDKPAEEIFREYLAMDTANGKPHMPAAPSHENDRDPGRRLRVGFLSPDFREHAARHFLLPLLENYDQNQVELFCYAEVPNPDTTTAQFQELASQWRSTVGLTNAEVSALIRQDKIDIMVDFGGHTSSSRLLALAYKPAPIQMTHYLGHGYTSGMTSMDAFISDQEMAPVGSEHLFSEHTIVRLTRIPVAYTPPEGMPGVTPLPAEKNGHVTFGYFGRTERINERVVSAWAQILAAVPDSRLMLNSRAFAEEDYCELFASRFAPYGISRKRIEMVYTSPQPSTWAAYGDIDIALDPFPHNAGTTTIESLYLGVPVVSVNDRPSVGRFGASILGAAGLSDWVAPDIPSYVALAAAKASNLSTLADLRRGMRDRFLSSPLADGSGLAREFEQAYRLLWQRWCQTEAPTQLALPAATPSTQNSTDLYQAAAAAFNEEDYERAIAIASNALALNDRDVETRHLRGVAKYRNGKLADAAEDLLTATKHAPHRADIRWNVTPMLRTLGRLDEALEQGDQAVQLAPNSPEAHNNVGSVYKDLGRITEAEHHYRQAIAINPKYADAWSNLSWALSFGGSVREGETAAREAIRLLPRSANAYNNLGSALMQQDRLREAGDAFARAVELNPNFSVAHSNQLFCLNYRRDLTAEQIFEKYREWDKAHASALRPENVEYRGSKDPDRKLKIGYVSPDFRYHAVSFFVEAFMAEHDDKEVEITCYSSVVNPDHVTERFKTIAHRWRHVLGLSDADLAKLIQDDEIDVLIDLAGHTGGNRLLTFARRPAPIQLTHIVGAGNTTGLKAIDGCFLDWDMLPAEYDHLFAEKPIRLSRMPNLYVPPAGMPETAPLPFEKNGYMTFGSFSRAARINDDVIATWARILRSVPGSRLLLNSKPFREEDGRTAWRKKFGNHNISEDRVQLVYTSPQPKTWEAYSQVDVALDPFPHNAGTTTIEALHQGVPVVSLAARPPVGRFGASILGAVGMSDWVTHTPDEYVARAVTAAANPHTLSQLRKGLRATLMQSPLGSDARGLTAEIEAKIRKLWRAYCAK